MTGLWATRLTGLPTAAAGSSQAPTATVDNPAQALVVKCVPP